MKQFSDLPKVEDEWRVRPPGGAEDEQGGEGRYGQVTIFTSVIVSIIVVIVIFLSVIVIIIMAIAIIIVVIAIIIVVI